MGDQALLLSGLPREIGVVVAKHFARTHGIDGRVRAGMVFKLEPAMLRACERIISPVLFQRRMRPITFEGVLCGVSVSVGVSNLLTGGAELPRYVISHAWGAAARRRRSSPSWQVAHFKSFEQAGDDFDVWHVLDVEANRWSEM